MPRSRPDVKAGWNRFEHGRLDNNAGAPLARAANKATPAERIQTMKLLTALATTTTLFVAPAVAQEMEADVANGESQFARQCVSCHVIADESGEVLAGRAGKIGPNLYGVIGRQPGSVEDFRYSDAIVAYGELAPADDLTGAAPQGEAFETVVWGHDNTTAYLKDPTSFLRDALDDPRARSKMAYKVRDDQDAIDITAYLATFSPDFDAEGMGSDGDAAMDGETMEGDAMDGETMEGDAMDDAAKDDGAMESETDADTTAN